MDDNNLPMEKEIYSYNNEILLTLVNKLENIIKDLNIDKNLDYIIEELKNVIILINNLINENKKNLTINSTKIYDFGKYVGEMKNEKREGIGICYYNNGSRFEGNWKNDQAEKGIMYYNNGERYEGEIKNTLREGKGSFYYEDGEIYNGDWKNHYKEGKGIFYYNNGDIYEGNYKNDKREGIGIYYFSTGNIYVGDWKNGKREGKGIIYYSNNDRKMGDYLNGEPKGKHIILSSKGEVFSELHE